MADHFDPYHVWLGIPPEEQPPNHYRLLGLRALETDQEVISNALDQRLAFLRTFQAGKRAALSQKLLNEVSAAGVALLNAEKKRQYDDQLRRQKDPGSPATVIPAAPAAPLPTARPLALQVAPIAPAPVVPVAPPQSIAAPEIVPAFVAPPARLRSPVPRGAESGLSPHLLPLLAAVVGLVGLAVLAVGGWWLMRDFGKPVVHKPPIATPDDDDGKSEKTAGGTDSAPPTDDQKLAMPVAAITATDRQIWLADPPTQRVLRRVGTRWIDYRERSEDWYEPGTPGNGSVRLSDPARRISIELFADRMEVSHANSAPAVVATGRWVSDQEVPTFAKRPPASRAPDPLRWRSASWHALVLDGNSSISLPVPPEIAKPGADFTIEMWARFDANFPDSHLIVAEPLKLYTQRPRLEGGGPPSMLMADLKSGPLGIAVRPPVFGDRWHHWAIVRAGNQLRLFVDGQSRAGLPLADSYAIRSPSLFIGGGDNKQEPHLRGMIRAVRVSSVARYKQGFRPPLHFVKDEHTLVLPKFEAAAESRLEDLSGHGHHGSRGSAQWLPLSQDEGIVQAELPADYVDLERAMNAEIYTLRGSTEGSVAFHDTKSAQGLCQMLLPYQPQGDYDLVLEVERLAGEGGPIVGLVLGSECAQLALGINVFADQGGPYTGILPADLKLVAATPRLIKHEPVLRGGQRHEVVVRVRNSGFPRYTLQVLVDGQTLCSLSDTVTNSALSPDLALPQKAALFWGSQNAEVRCHSFRVYPPGKSPGSGTLAANSSAANSGAATPSPPRPTAVVSTPSAKAAVAGKAWLASEPEKLAIRLVNGRWVEFRERDEFWYGLADASPREYLLTDASRKVELRLRDSEVAIRTPMQDWASLGPGRWVDVGELPAFATRPRSAKPTDPAQFREPVWHALMFDGRSALRMPLPPEMTGPGTDFTVEAWVRFDPWAGRPLVRLLSIGSLGAILGPASPPSSNPDTRELHLVANGMLHRIPLTLPPDRWKHLAIVRAADEMRVYLDGSLLAVHRLPDQFTLESRDPSLVFGQVSGLAGAGFSGLVRDLHVSKFARYAAPFTPPLRSLPDSDSLALPKFLADAKPAIDNLAPGGGTFLRDKAQWVTLSHWGDLAGLRPDGSLDLTRLYSVSNHTLLGKFYRTSEYTDTLTPAGPALVLVPHWSGPNYDMELEATRLAGEGGVLLGVMLGDKQALLGIDLNAAQGRRTGILYSDLAQITTKADLTSHEPLLATGARHRFTVKVRQPTSGSYSVEVNHNGSSHVATMEGKIAQVAAPPAWTTRLATGMSLGSFDARIRFHSLVLTPVAGVSTASSQNTAAAPPTSPPQQATSGAPPAGNAGAPPNRQPVPSAAELEKGLADARNAFAAEFQSATKPAQKAVLARTIRAAAENSKGDRTARYVLIDLARKVFIQAGEVDNALAAARTLEQEFDVPQDQLVIESLAALDETVLPAEQRTIMAKTAIDLAEEWLADDEFDQAEKLATIASQSAGKQKDAELRKDVAQRRGQIVRVVSGARAVESSMKVLETTPDDPAANLAVGKFRCFVQEDWTSGLTNLLKGGELTIAGAAGRDLTAAASGKPADLAASGESWLKLAADAKLINREDRPAVQRRAKEQLTAALPGLTGLEALRIQRRLDEIKDVAAPAPKRPTRTRAPRGAGLSGLIGRVLVRGQDAGVVVTYQPGYTVTQEDVQLLVAAAGAGPGDDIRVELVGILSLTSDSRIQLKHAGGSSSGGVHTLKIGNQTISEIGDDRSKDDSREVPLAKGQHGVRWTLTGGDLGTALLSLVPVDSAGKPQEGVATVQFTRDMNVFAHSVPYRNELRWAEQK